MLSQTFKLVLYLLAHDYWSSSTAMWIDALVITFTVLQCLPLRMWTRHYCFQSVWSIIILISPVWLDRMLKPSSSSGVNTYAIYDLCSGMLDLLFPSWPRILPWPLVMQLFRKECWRYDAAYNPTWITAASFNCAKQEKNGWEKAQHL